MSSRLQKKHKPFRKQSFHKAIPTIQEQIASYNSQVEYIKCAVKYMFLANGGAATAILFHFNINEYSKPILLFAAGVSYSVLIPIWMYFIIKLHEDIYINNITWYIKLLIGAKKIFGKFTIIMLYLPMFMFLLGLHSMINIFFKNNPKINTEIITNMLDILIKMVTAF